MGLKKMFATLFQSFRPSREEGSDTTMLPEEEIRQRARQEEEVAAQSPEQEVTATPLGPEERVAELLEAGRLDEAEKAVERLLEDDPGSDAARKLWKKVRKKQGKPLVVDLPVEKKQEIFQAYYKYTNDYEHDVMSRAAGTDKKMFRGGLSFYDSDQVPEQRVLAEFDLTKYELDLLLHEGERESWPVERQMRDTGAPAPEMSFADKYKATLKCVHCGKPNPAPFWPEKGNLHAFYNQSAERAQEEPGEFRLPIVCPFCEKTWFVVWDEDPDPLANQYLAHLERMCDQSDVNEHAKRVWRGMITEENLGKVLRFVYDNMKEAWDAQELRDHSFVEANYYVIVTLVPAVEPFRVGMFLGGSYFKYMEDRYYLTEWVHTHGKRLHLVNWVHCFDLEGKEAPLNLQFFPSEEDNSKMPTMYPWDVLSDEERAMVQGAYG